MNKPKISIIMPIFNPNMEWLESAIDSVINQTFTDWELIIINDGSTKNIKFPRKISTLIESKKIIVAQYSKNRNQATAMNVGIDIARGDYICFLDYDDKYHEDKLKIQFNFLENNDYDMVYNDGYYINENDNIIREMDLPQFSSQILNENLIAVGGVMVKRECFDKLKFDMNINRSQDWEMWIKLYKNNFKIIHHKDKLFYYRVHDKQKSIIIPKEKTHNYIKEKWIN